MLTSMIGVMWGFGATMRSPDRSGSKLARKRSASDHSSAGPEGSGSRRKDCGDLWVCKIACLRGFQHSRANIAGNASSEIDIAKGRDTQQHGLGKKSTRLNS